MNSKPSLSAPPRPCQQCGGTTARHTWQQDRLGRKHIRRECARCGTWLGFAPRVAPFTTEADAQASPTALLDALMQLEDLGLELRSDGATVWFAPGDWRRVPPSLYALVRQCNHQLARLLGRRLRERE